LKIIKVFACLSAIVLFVLVAYNLINQIDNLVTDQQPIIEPKWNDVTTKVWYVTETTENTGLPFDIKLSPYTFYLKKSPKLFKEGPDIEVEWPLYVELYNGDQIIPIELENRRSVWNWYNSIIDQLEDDYEIRVREANPWVRHVLFPKG
jgi:hypothetical protein